MATAVHPPRGARAPGGAPAAEALTLRGFFGVFRYSRRALELVWTTNRGLTVALALLTLLAGALPASVVYVGSLIVDAVLAAMGTGSPGRVVELVILEGALVAAIAGAQRGLSLCQSLLRAQLGQRVNVMILEKALTLELQHFEDSEFYDKLTRARREASTRPLSLVMRTFGLVQNAISLVSYGALLVRFSPWAVLVLLVAGLPAFVAEAKFSGDAFRLFRWRSPETRMQIYLETVIAREDHAKEVMLYGLGPRLLERYRDIFRRLYREDRDLTVRRDSWGFALGLIGTAVLYGAYAWIAVSAVRRLITLGQMTRYVALFRQGQAAVSAMLAAVGGMYEDNLYLSTLYEYLETHVPRPSGSVVHGPLPEDGVRFEDVSFTYPGAEEPALEHITLHLTPGTSLALVGENGSGKTTLIKLLTRLYAPSSGRILLDGQDLAEWEEAALRERIGVIFQDFARYQMLVGENVGAGDERSSRTSSAGAPPPSKGARTSSSTRCPRATRHSSVNGSATGGSSPAGSGRRSRCRAPSCARVPISWCSMSRPPPWMHRRRPKCSSISASSRAIASPSSSRTASPRCGWRIRSWCSTAAASSSGAATRS